MGGENKDGGLGKSGDAIAALPDDKVDERYKNLDPRMVEMIENEIMERKLDITWDDIAGLI